MFNASIGNCYGFDMDGKMGSSGAKNEIVFSSIIKLTPTLFCVNF